MIGTVVREAAAAARSQPVASAITILMVVGMILAVMLTVGRTVGAEQEVLSSIDSAGTRSIMVRADGAAGVDSDVLERVESIEGIEWSGAFSSATDSTNTRVPGGVRVPVRYAYGSQLDRLGIPVTSPVLGQVAWGSELALEQLGIPGGAGSITLTNGASIGVVGHVEVPDFLRDLEPLVMVPRTAPRTKEPIGILIVIAERPELVAPISDAVLSVLGADDPSKVTVHTSEELAELRGLIQAQLGSFSRGLVLALLAVTGALVAILLYGLVVMRRKDFGRRRALGATRSLIVSILLTQTALLAGIGTVVGIGCATAALLVSGSPLPGTPFTVALAVLALITAMTAALIPAVLASRREPIRELRVP